MPRLKKVALVFTPALAGVLVLLGVMHTAATAQAGTLFVAADGTGTACTQAHPCALSTALARAHDGDTLYLAGGRYTGTGAAVITSLPDFGTLGGRQSPCLGCFGT